MSYRIVRVHANLTDLEGAVADFIADGWQAQGSPFFDGGSRQWCQAMTKPATETLKPGQVKLREPKR